MKSTKKDETLHTKTFTITVVDRQIPTEETLLGCLTSQLSCWTPSEKHGEYVDITEKSNFSLSSIALKKDQNKEPLPWDNHCTGDYCACEDEFHDKVAEIVQDEILFSIKETVGDRCAQMYEDALEKWDKLNS